MKILFGASVYNHLSTFHKPFMESFQKQGYEVHAIGGNSMGRKEEMVEMGVICHDVEFDRFPFSKKNLSALRSLNRLFDQHYFDLVHVHTPTAAFLIRYAALKHKQGKILYTAHGFHFYKGAPFVNWLIYYPLERLAARWTDMLITINHEDYTRALKMGTSVRYVHGVGVEPADMKMTVEARQSLKRSLELSESAVVISYVAEINQNKNHAFLLKNWKQIKEKSPHAVLLLIGEGDRKAELEQFIVEEQLVDIKVLGYRNDVHQLLRITDIVSLLSYREGLPKSIMEAMAASIPCVVADTRGLRDLISNDRSGYVVSHGDDQVLVDSFVALLNDTEQRLKMGVAAYQDVEPYRLENVLQEYISVYDELGKG